MGKVVIRKVAKMNERIKQLAEQAGIYQPDRFDAINGSNQMEKFAELIIQECLDVARQRLFTNYEGDSYRVAHNNAIWCSLQDIEEHFGVEE